MQLIAIAVSCLIVLCGVGYALYTYFDSRRTVTNLLEQVGRALNLVRAPASATIFEARRNLVGLAAEPVAQGEWLGIPVELTFLPKAGAICEKSVTGVTLVWPKPVARVGIDRHQTLGEPNDLIERHPSLGRAATSDENGPRWVKDPWFGPSKVWGRQDELDRVLGPAVRAKLQTFPRELAVVYFHDRVMVMQWYGLEHVPSIVQQAFDLGIACLEMLAPRQQVERARP